MSEAAYCGIVADLMIAVGESFQRPRLLPAFLLFYTSIDVVSSLTRPVTQEDTHPGYAIHLDTDNGSRDFAICLDCSYVEAFGDRKDYAEYWLDKDQLAKLKVFYGDEFIRNLGGEKKSQIPNPASAHSE